MDYVLCSAVERYRHYRRNVVTAIARGMSRAESSSSLREVATSLNTVWPGGALEVDMYETDSLYISGRWDQWEG